VYVELSSLPNLAVHFRDAFTIKSRQNSDNTFRNPGGFGEFSKLAGYPLNTSKADFVLDIHAMLGKKGQKSGEHGKVTNIHDQPLMRGEAKPLSQAHV
jgi:hypothetical protein